MPGPRAGGRTRRRHPAPVSPSLAALGERLRAARVAVGLSQGQLGKPHFTRAYVSAVELGKIRPSVKSLEFLADRLGKPVSFFLEDADSERRRREREFTMLRAKELIARGQAREAVEMLEVLTAEVADSRERLALQRLLARGYTEAGQPAKSLPLLQAAMAVAEGRSDRALVALVHRQFAQAYAVMRELRAAQDHVAKAIDMARAGIVREPLFLVHCLQIRGSVEIALGRREDAVRSLEESLELGKDVGDSKWLATVYAALGSARWMAGDVESAIGWMTKSVALLESLKNMALAAEIRLRLGTAVAQMGHSERAKELIESALLDASRFDRRATVAECYAMLSKLASLRGSATEARELGQRAVEMADSANDPWAQSEILFRFGEVLEHAEDRPSADAKFREAMEIAVKQGLGNVRNLYARYSEILAARGSHKEAGEWARKALRLESES